MPDWDMQNGLLVLWWARCYICDSTCPPKVINSSKDKEDDCSSDSGEEHEEEMEVGDQSSLSCNSDGDSNVTEAEAQTA